METEITKKDWWDAGCVKSTIDMEKVAKALGKPLSEVERDWTWGLACAWVYKILTGKELVSPYQGRGRTSRYYGEEVAKVWPNGEMDFETY